MIRFQGLTTAATLLLAVFLLTFGCKSSNSDPGTTNLTTVQGNWKVTGLTVDPAVVYMGLSITDASGALQTLEGGCLSNVVVTFNANGTVTNNLASQTTCASATNTQRVVGTFFGTTNTYTESGGQLTLKTPALTQPAVATEVFTTNTVTLTTKLPVDPLNNPVTTTYKVVLTKQ